MTTPAPACAPGQVWRALVLAGLAAATVAAFASLWNADWILFDDPAYVSRNPAIARGLTWDGLRWICAHPHGGNFHPVTSISHMLDSQVFGAGARGPHMVNVALHAANAVLVCIVLWRFTAAWWPSVIVAALFALHPLRVESVAWISERKDVLSTLFFLLALLAYERWARASTLGRYALVVIFYLLGLLSKPMLVTFPFVLLLLDVWPLRRASWPLLGRGHGAVWREKLPLFAIAGLGVVVTFLVQRAAGAVMAAETLSVPQRIVNATASYGRYLGSISAPKDLANFYPLTNGWPIGLASLAASILVVATLFAWRSRGRFPYVMVGWAWFLGTLIPVIGLVQVGSQSHADRYTYIPSIGLGLAIVWLGFELTSKARAARAVFVTAACLSIVACGIGTDRVARRWKDTRTLFTHALSVTPPNAVALQNLGNAVLIDGEVDRAIEFLEQALELIPNFPDAENNLGTALGLKGRHDEAIAHFRAALKTENTAEIHQNLGWALEQAGRGDEAIPAYQAALELDPDFAAAHQKLGAMLCARGRFGEAVTHLQRALALEPDDIETHRSLAITCIQQGLVEDGIRAYREVLKRSPDDPDALNNIAWIRATHADPAHRDGAEAVRLAERARDVLREPNHVLTSTLAAAYAEVGRFEDAERTAERAIELGRERADESAVRSFLQQLEVYRARRAFHH